MDKIELTRKDIDTMLSWRDEHKSLVRQMPCPLKAVEIVFTDSADRLRAKYIRDGRTLTVQPNARGISIGKITFRQTLDRAICTGKPKHMPTELVQDILTIYATACALMVYAEPAPSNTPNRPYTAPASKPRDAQRRQKNKTYILRRAGSRIAITQTGHHASPRGEFTVRGHYRHYKSGKVIWVAEYRKGKGKRRPTTYTLGQIE